MEPLALGAKTGRRALLAATLAATPAHAQTQGQATPGERRFETLMRFTTPAARQGVCADADHVFVVDDRLIVKFDRRTQAEVARFESPRDGPIIHMNSLSLHEGQVLAAHSNYPEEPMLSSVERFDAGTLRHAGSHSFGIMPGSLTAFEWHEGAWWAVWANYSRVFGRNQRPYGNTWWTHITRHAPDDLRQTGGWTFPPDILRRAEPMSVSGASWGPGGLLWCTGHDHKEVYALRLPRMGSVLERVLTLPIEAEGQAIAWDRSAPDVLWQIVRSRREVVAQRLLGG
ncbi:MAG: hypothetical protein AVDCRST_MAG04-963 [uncultured Acetobacteraceae bacterium]|uniref:Uncharacterized protein n=1 Tax=uncultured Acetobacteraceae bacterium TaxID=169975 RepID=A0A6J4HNT0_9PROT|nr:MAG: hypothetical protein AVDCRST_MAG04-963 [uncultured Acetobacteraceae bacterium]